MRVLIAPDSFGGTMTAAEAATAIAVGWRRHASADELILRPLSDGGPGMVDVLHATLGGARRECVVSDPLGRDTRAETLSIGSTAYVESAQACGLHLVAEPDRDPKIATSYGLGQLLREAADAGAERIVVGLGGSATNDGGAGMLAALGIVALDADGTPLPPGGAALRDCRGLRIDAAEPLPRVSLVIASDVDSPLVGLHGASAVYGPQKGAGREDVMLLDAALEQWARVLESDPELGVAADLAAAPGAGAAGGLGAALLALGGRRESGIELVRGLIGFDRALDDAELVLTGEGSFDFQSLRGKVAAGVAAGAAERGIPCLVLAGQVQVGRREAASIGIEATYGVAELVGSVSAAIAAGAGGLSDLAATVAREWSR